MAKACRGWLGLLQQSAVARTQVLELNLEESTVSAK